MLLNAKIDSTRKSNGRTFYRGSYDYVANGHASRKENIEFGACYPDGRIFVSDAFKSNAEISEQIMALITVTTFSKKTQNHIAELGSIKKITQDKEGLCWVFFADGSYEIVGK